MKKLIIIIFTMLILSTQLTWATDYYVTQSGAGDYSGQPNFANAMSVATFNALTGTGYAGSTFYFSGEFTTWVEVGISGTVSADGSNDVKLDGWEGGTCTPVASDGCGSAADLTIGIVVNENVAYLDIQDFQVSSTAADYPAFWILDGVNHLRIKKNYVYETGGRSINSTCTSGNPCDHVIIEENRVKNFARLGNSAENFNFDYINYFLIKGNWVSMEEGFANYCDSCNIAASHSCHNVLMENNDFHDGYGIEDNSTGFALKESGQQSEWVIRFNKFHGTTGAGITIGTAFEDPRVWNIYIYGNFMYDNRGFGGSSYYYADNHYWWSNLFINNGGSGLHMWTIDGRDAPTDIYAYNNTFARNGDLNPLDTNPTDWTRGGYVSNAGSGHILKNNIFYNNRHTGTYGYQQIGDSTGLTTDYNTLYHSEGTPIWYYDGAARSLATMQGTYAQETHGEVANPGFTDPDGVDNTHGTADDDYTLTGATTVGEDLSACFSVDLSNGDAWFETLSGYGQYVQPCIDDALDPNGTDWTTTPPTVATVKRDTYGWSRGAYAYQTSGIIPIVLRQFFLD